MPGFDRGLGRLEEQKVMTERARKESAARAGTKGELSGATFKDGQRVKDTLTGELGRVISTTFPLALEPADTTGMFPIPHATELEVVLVRLDGGRRLSRNPAELEKQSETSATS